MMEQWWFTVVDKLLHLQSTTVVQPIPVSDVQMCTSTPGANVKIVLEERTISLPIGNFKAVDKRFSKLESHTSRRKFCSIVQQLVRQLCPPTEEYGSDVEEQEAPRTQKEHRTFKQEVELMRRHHPENGVKEVDEFLDSSNRKWRSHCTEIFGFSDKATFGGCFREQIYCSCLPQCCYDELQRIFEACARGQLVAPKPVTKVKAGLFKDLVGCRDEPRVHHLLARLADGLVSVNSFRSEAIKLKGAKSIDNQQTPTKEQNLQSENERLMGENALLKKEIENLKRKLRNKDVFHFDEDDTDVGEPVRQMQRIVMAEVHAPKQQHISSREMEFQDLMEELREDQVEYVEIIDGQLDQIIDQQETITPEAAPITPQPELITQEPEPITPEPTSKKQPKQNRNAVYIKGEKVLADWEGTWYQAVILRVNKTKGYYIKYLVDKVRTTVQADRLKKVS